MKKAYEFLKACGTFYLATVEGDQPRVRPFGAVAVFEDKLYITTSNQKKVYAQLMADPKVEISGMVGDKWLRLSATAVRDDRFAARAAMLGENPNLRALYNENDGIMEVLFLKDADAAICSFVEAPQHWTF